MAELVYNVTEAAAALGISRRTMYEDVCCKGEFQSLIQHDCGSLVVNGQAVVGKEENEYFQAFS